MVHPALMDAGFEVSGMMAGDVGRISQLIQAALTDILVNSNRPYALAIQEHAAAIESLARQQ